MDFKKQQQTTTSKNKQQFEIPAARRNGKKAVPDRYKNRPALIRAWLYRAWVIADEEGLSRGTLAVLQAIIASGLSTTQPQNHVFTKRSTLARLGQVGEATVYRALDQLEEKNLITRYAQERLGDGSLHLGKIIITDKFAQLFGITNINSQKELTTENNEQEERLTNNSLLSGEGVACCQTNSPKNTPFAGQQLPADSTHRPSATEMIDGVIDGPVYEELELQPKASVNNQSAAAQFVRRNGRSVPQELVWLIDEKRLTFGGLFKLMSLAKQVVGQKLSDFVQLRIERLKELPSHKDCYRYLKSLITQGIDARYLCREQAKRVLQVTQKAREKSLAEERAKWIRAKHGHVFINEKTGQKYQIDADYNLLRLPDNSPNLAINNRFIRAVETGELTPYVEKIETTSKERAREILHGLRQMLRPGTPKEPMLSII